MLSDQRQYFFPYQFFCDCLVLLAVYGVCIFAAGTGTGGMVSPVPADGVLLMCILLAVLTLMFLRLYGCYDFPVGQGVGRLLRHTGMACLLSGTVAVFILLLLSRVSVYGRITLFLVCFSWPALVLSRAAVTVLISGAQEKSSFVKHIMLVGTDRSAHDLETTIIDRQDGSFVLVGCLAAQGHSEDEHTMRTPLLGSVENFDAIVDEHIVDCVVYAGDYEDMETVRSVARRCHVRGIDFVFGADPPGDSFNDIRVEHIGCRALFLCRAVEHYPVQLFVKRCFDIAVSAIFIIACIPVWILVPVLVKLTSAGPVFFVQERVGKNGRLFNIYKFRSMVVGADKMQEKLSHLNEMDGPVFKIKNDPRFTPIGAFLRKTSIDELPQFFNVFRGDMSLVGPRPPLMKEVRQYRPWQKKRLSVTPGITCLWQITGRNHIRFDEWMHLDIEYIENWSLLLDLKILIRTFHAVILRKGAQ